MKKDLILFELEEDTECITPFLVENMSHYLYKRRTKRLSCSSGVALDKGPNNT